MAMTPHVDPGSPNFPGDPSPQPPFGLRDSLQSGFLWSIGLAELSLLTGTYRALRRFTDGKNIDFLAKLMGRAIPRSVGIKVVISGVDAHDKTSPCVYVSNHVNIFDLCVLYAAIPQYTRALEHVDHFSWPIIGPFLRDAGQIPIDPDNPRQSAKALRQAARFLGEGNAITVLPEGSRTLDGTVGHFFPGAFRLAIRARVPVVPIALRGGRALSRRGDWRMRPGLEEVLFGAPISTVDLKLNAGAELADRCREIIIDLLQGRRAPGT